MTVCIYVYPGCGLYGQESEVWSMKCYRCMCVTSHVHVPTALHTEINFWGRCRQGRVGEHLVLPSAHTLSPRLSSPLWSLGLLEGQGTCQLRT